jgi:hypothetical protein
MTERERLSRETLIKRAAAGAAFIYAAPVVTGAAAAAPERRPCDGTRICTPGPKGDKKCRRKSGRPDCGCRSPFDNCFLPCRGGVACDVSASCGTNCGCHVCFGSGGKGHGCMDLRDGQCASFLPCSNGSCPAGQRCFETCCPQPICAEPCTGTGSAGRTKRMGSGPRLSLPGAPKGPLEAFPEDEFFCSPPSW